MQGFGLWYDILIYALILGPYIILGSMWIYDHTGYGRKRQIKSVPEELIQIFINTGSTNYRETVSTWLELNDKRIENGKIV